MLNCISIYTKIDFSKFCGRDEDGDSKAICTLQEACVDLEVAIDIGQDIVTIDVKFENYLDFEYLQAGELCLQYKEKHSKRGIKKLKVNIHNYDR